MRTDQEPASVEAFDFVPGFVPGLPSMFALRTLLPCLVRMLKATDTTTFLTFAGLAQR